MSTTPSSSSLDPILAAAAASLAAQPRAIVNGTSAADVLSAGAWASNQVVAGEGDDTIVSGNDARNADTLNGGAGADTYILGAGWGVDTITDTQDASVIQFMDLRRDQLRFGTDADGSLTITHDDRQIHDGLLQGGVDTLVINQFSASQAQADARVQRFVFADGQTASAQEILALIQAKTTAGNDLTTGTAASEQIDGLAGRDTLWGQAGNDTLLSGAGNDKLYGGQGNDVYDGGAGRDVLIDGVPLAGGQWGVQASSDTYVLQRGGGADVVIDLEVAASGAQPAATQDTIRLGAGIRPQDVLLYRVYRSEAQLSAGYDSLVVRLKDSPDSLTVIGQFSDFGTSVRTGIDQLVFEDGTVWGMDEVQRRLVDARADGYARVNVTAGDDMVILQNGQWMSGSSGADTISVSRDVMTCIIDESDGVDDDVLLLPDALPQNVEVLSDLYGRVILRVDGVQLLQLNTYDTSTLPSVEFADGTRWSPAELRSRNTVQTVGNLMQGSDGDDTVSAQSGKVLDAGLGDDQISVYGADGAVIRWRPGQGDDTVAWYQPGNVVIELGSPDDVAVQGYLAVTGGNVNGLSISGKLILSGVQPNGGSLTLPISYFGSPVMQSDTRVAVQFADGSPAWTVGDLAQRMIANQLASPDIQVGTAADDTIIGGADIRGGAGNDLIQDPILNASGAYPFLPTGAVTVVHYGLGDGQDTVTSRNVTLQFDAGIDPAMVRISEVPTGGPDGAVLRKVRFEGQAGGLDVSSLAAIRFANGTVWGQAEIVANASVNPAVLGPLDGEHDYRNAQANMNLLGGTGNDSLFSGSGNDTLRGEAGNDYLSGGAGNDVIIDTQGSGNYLDGGLGNDRIEGVGYLYGGPGNDTIVATGDATVNLTDLSNQGGQDQITATATANIVIGLSVTQKATFQRQPLKAGETTGLLSLDAGNTYDTIVRLVAGEPDAQGQATTARDIIQAGTGQVLLHMVGDEHFTVNQYNRFGHTVRLDATLLPTVDAREDIVLQGTSAADRLTAGSAQRHALLGGLGNDTLVGGAGRDLLVGGAGDDDLTGGAGADTFLVSYGGGTDRIHADAQDTVQLQGGLLNMLRIGVWNDADDTVTVTLGGFFDDPSEVMVFDHASQLSGLMLRSADVAQTALSWDQVMKQAVVGERYTGTNNADTLSGGAGFDTLYGGGGNDVISGGGAADQLFGELGNDTLQGGDGRDTLDGGANDDLLDGGDGNDVLIIGQGNDVVTGGAGADEFRFNQPVGADRFTTVHADAQDTLTFQFDVAFNQSGYIYRNDDTLELRLMGSGDMRSRVMLDGISQLSTLSLTDSTGETVRVSDLMPLAIRNLGGTAAADTLTGFAGQDLIYGEGGDDVLSGLAGDDSLLGGAGLDVIDGGAGRDQLTGGAGNDTLTGGDGADTFFLAPGDGLDLIHADGQDTLQLDGTRSDMTVGRLGALGADTVQLTFSTARGGSAGFAGALLDHASQLNGLTLRFADNSTMAWSEVMALATKPIEPPNLILNGTTGKDTLTGGAGNDTLNGLAGNDTLSGGLGDDRLVGDKGNDTYLFARGDGRDTIVDKDSTWFNSDVLKISNARSNQLWFTRAGTSLDIGIIGTSDHVIVQDWFTSSANRLEKITALGDNKSLNLSKLNSLISSMAGFTATAMAGTDLPANTPASLSKAISGSWTAA